MSSFRSQPGQPKTKLLSIERVVALLTPLFAALAGLVTSLVAKLLPGVTLSTTDLTVLFGIGATAGLGAALKWLHGRARYTELMADLSTGAHRAESSLAPVLGSAPAKDIEQVLEAHRQSIIDGIGKALPVPASAQEVAREIIGQLWPRAQAPPQDQTAPLAGPGPQAS